MITSGGAHLCARATQCRIPKKERRNGGEPPTPIAMSLITTLSGWYKASLNLNFRMFCAIIKATKKSIVSFVVTSQQNYRKNRSCGKSVMMGRLLQTLIQTVD